MRQRLVHVKATAGPLPRGGVSAKLRQVTPQKDTAMPHRLLAALLCLAAAQTAAAQTDQFDGLYRPSGEMFAGWTCRADSVGMDGGAVAIRNGQMFGVESLCDLTNPVEVRDMNAVLYDKLCRGEGDEWTERVMLMRSKFTARVLYVISDMYVAEWEACEE